MAKITDKDFLRNPDLGLLLVRITVGGLLLFHGIEKLNGGLAGIEGMLAAMGLPTFLAYGALLCELVAAIMVLVGLWTRAASAAIVANMIVAILMAHASDIFSLNPATGGWAIELPMLYLLPALALCFTGGGRYALTKKTVLD